MAVSLIMALTVIFFLLIRILVSAYNLLSRPYPELPNESKIQEKVSVLIPARNEADNIGHLLLALQKFPNHIVHEILVLNDGSTDQTETIVRTMQLQDTRIRLLRGQALPPGWTGKNFACHQLAQAASGNYFLFLDADVIPQPILAASVVHMLRKHSLAVYSIFPDQKMETWGEKMVVPLMHYLLLSLLPLRWVQTMKNASFAAANGQTIAFDAAVYRKYRWHELVKHSVLDDVEIMRSVKKIGFKGRVDCANGLVTCRMYTDFNSSIDGFSKNLYAGFGKNIWGMSVYYFLLTFGYFFIYYTMGIQAFMIALVAALIIRVCISICASQSITANLVLHPIQILLFVFIGYRSAYKTVTNALVWKGRTISI